MIVRRSEDYTLSVVGAAVAGRVQRGNSHAGGGE